MRQAERGVPGQHSWERDGDQAGAVAPGNVPQLPWQQAGAAANVPDEDAVALARAARERLARSLAAIRAVPLAIRDEPSLVFQP
jgi:hypothetical protein